MQPPQWGPPQQPPAQVPYPAPLAPNEVICPNPNCGWRGVGHLRVASGVYGLHCARCGVYARPGQAPAKGCGALLALGAVLALIGGIGSALSGRGRSEEQSVTPQPPAVPADVDSRVTLAPAVTICPDGYTDEVMGRLRELGCETERRREVCRDWFVAITRLHITCTPGHREVVVQTVFPMRSEAAVTVARQTGNRTYIGVLRDSTGRLPSVIVQSADGRMLCRNFDGGAACITSLGEALRTP